MYNTENKSTLTEEEWNDVINFWDIEPSWQNSIDSVKSTIDSFIFSLVKENNKIIGYGIIDKIQEIFHNLQFIMTIEIKALEKALLRI